MPTTALLVIDLQRGAFDGVRYPPVDSPDRLIRNACTLVEAARAEGNAVVFVQHCESSGEFEEGTVHWLLHESLVPLPGESVVKKYASSAFEGTDLDTLLKAQGVTDLVLCGLQSEYCISNTAKSALASGLSVVVAGDAHGTWASENQSATEISEQVNRDLEAKGATLRDTASLLQAFKKTPV